MEWIHRGLVAALRDPSGDPPVAQAQPPTPHRWTLPSLGWRKKKAKR